VDQLRRSQGLVMSNTLKKHFEANMLDGDEVQAGQMMSSESVLEYIEEYMTPKPQANTLEEIAIQYGYDKRTKSKTVEVRVEDLEALIAEAQQNAVAWSIMVLDDLHTDCVDKYAMSAEFDKFYKGAKNTIRDRYKNETGVDPTPGYPISVQLKEKL